MTKEDDKASIAALLEEKRGYELRAASYAEAGEDDALAAIKERIKNVDDQLKALGHGAQKRSAKAEKRPSRSRASSR